MLWKCSSITNVEAWFLAQLKSKWSFSLRNRSEQVWRALLILEPRETKLDELHKPACWYKRTILYFGLIRLNSGGSSIQPCLLATKSWFAIGKWVTIVVLDFWIRKDCARHTCTNNSIGCDIFYLPNSYLYYSIPQIWSSSLFLSFTQL